MSWRDASEIASPAAIDHDHLSGGAGSRLGPSYAAPCSTVDSRTVPEGDGLPGHVFRDLVARTRAGEDVGQEVWYRLSEIAGRRATSAASVGPLREWRTRTARDLSTRIRAAAADVEEIA